MIVPRKNPHAVALGRKGGQKNPGAYLHSLTKKQLRAHQQKAAAGSAKARRAKADIKPQ